jgi:DNA-binding response OmpR family regulator
MSQSAILLVEDEAVARKVLQAMLVHAGYAVTAVGSGEEAIDLLDQHRYDLLLTDLQLRKIDGVQVMAVARDRDPDIEVIVLTGYATLDSAIAAVRHGAANYILKPGKPGEIERSVADALDRRRNRVERADWLRKLGQDLMEIANNEATPAAESVKTPSARNGDLLRVGSLSIDLQRHIVTNGERVINLSSGEFSLLAYLAEHNEQVVSPQQLVRDVLGYECTPQEARDLIKARIWSLRRKIEDDPTAPTLILSVRGVGYVLTDGSRPV